MTAAFPVPISIDGIRSDHTDAATMTPDANPISAFRRVSDISRFIKKTNDEPNTVPRKGIINAIITA
jgi:hypothetical protein